MPSLLLTLCALVTVASALTVTLTTDDTYYATNYAVNGEWVTELTLTAKRNTSQSPVSVVVMSEMQYLYYLMHGLHTPPVTPQDRYGGVLEYYYVPNIPFSSTDNWSQLEVKVVNQSHLMGIRDNVYVLFQCNGDLCTIDVERVDISTLPLSQLPLLPDQAPSVVSGSTWPGYQIVIVVLSVTVLVMLVGGIALYCVKWRRTTDYMPLE